MGDLTAWLDGSPLRRFGAYSDLSVTWEKRGSATCSWRMNPDRLHHMARLVGARVEVRASGGPIWSGHLDEPGMDGEFHASGLPVLADNAPARDLVGDPASDPVEATNLAIDRGDLDGWRKNPAAIGVLSGAPADSTTVANVWDQVAESLGRQWMVTPRGVVDSYEVAPATPRWHIKVPGGYQYGYDLTGLVTHLTGLYMVGFGDTVEVTIATGVGGIRRPGWVDLTDWGLMSEAEAVDKLEGLAVAQGMVTPAPTTKVEVGWGQVRTSGGTVVPPWLPRIGDTARLWGATDGLTGRRYLDVVLAGMDYEAASDSAVLTPMHLAPRGFSAVQQEALSA